MRRRIAAVVEGHGEVEALPLLLRRLHEREGTLCFPEIGHSDVIRVPRSRMVKEGEIERAVELAARKVGKSGAILVLLDADDDLACRLGPSLTERAAARKDVDVAVVVVVREWESWFVQAAASLAGTEGLPLGLTAPADPTAIRGAKEWLSARMGAKGPYRERLHQAKFTARLDLGDLAADRSFRKLEKEVRRLLNAAAR